MSDDPTKRFDEQGKDTQPMLETILTELRELRAEMNRRFEDAEIRADRVESEVKQARSETLALRADMKELRREVREHFKQPA
jgi:predicted  nucleic acid-binding Zn-ribbon protein